MKKRAVLFSMILMFVISVPAFASTPLLSGVPLFFLGNTNNTTLPSSGTALSANILTDNNRTGTSRQMGNNGAIFGDWNTQRMIDSYSIGFATNITGAINFRLILFNDDNSVAYDSTITIPTTVHTSEIPNVKAYAFKLINTSGTTLSVGEFNLTYENDVNAPTAPTLNAAQGNLSINLSWTKPTDLDLVGYRIYRGGTLLTTINDKNTLTYTDSGLTPGVPYTYTVTAFDDNISPNESLPSNSAPATATDTVAPTQPGLLSRTNGDRQVTLNWSASTDNHAVAGYRIRRDGSLIATVTSTTFTETGLTNGTTYNYTVAAIDTINESAASSISATPIDTTGPDVPSINFSHTGEYSITVTFNDSTSADTTSYILQYRRSTDTTFIDTVITDTNAGTYSRQFTPLLAGTTYTFRLLATDDDGNTSTGSSVNRTTTNSAPPSPTGRTIAAGDRQVTLAWNPVPATITDFSHYRIIRPPTPNIITTSTSQTITGLTNGVQVCYSIASVDTANNASTPAPICATPFDTTPPPAPTVTSTVGSMSVTLDWSAPSTDTISYSVYRKTGGVYSLLSSGGSTSATFSTAVGISYTYVITATDDDGNTSDYSADVTITGIDTVPPTPPGSLAATAGDKQVALNWSASTDDDGVAGYDVSYYVIYFGDGTTATTTATSYTFTGLTNDTLYTFEVKAFDASGNVSAAATTTATPTDVSAPVMPDISAGSIGETTAEITFADGAASDIVSYELSRSPSFFPRATINDTNAATYTALFEGLASSATYTIYARAKDDDGNTSAVKTIIVTTTAVPPAVPTGLVATPGDRRVTLDWADNTEDDLAGYRITRVDTGDETNVVASSRLFTGLTNDVEVCFSVAAYDTWGNTSSDSGAVCTTPIDDINPEPPTNVIATAGYMTINLSWTASSSDDVLRYKVYEIIGGAPSLVLSTADSSVTSANFSRVNLNSLTYRVETIDDDLNVSTLSAAVTAAAFDNVAPTVPGSLVDTPSDKQVALNWSPSSDLFLTGYLIKQNGVTIADITETDYIVTGLTNGTTYSFSVIAYDSSGNLSAAASITSAPLDNVAPAVPTGLSVLTLDNTLRYSWTASSSADVAGYKLYKVGETTPTWTGSNLTTDVTGLVNGNDYYYQVSAYDSAGNESSKSAAVMGAPVDLFPPFDVSEVDYVGETEYSLTFKFPDSSSADTDYYRIYRDITTDTAPRVGIGIVNDVPGATEYTYTASGLTPGVSYVFTVASIDDDGNESPAGVTTSIAFTPVSTPPNPPSGLSATPGTGSISFSWTASSSADLEGYRLFRIESGVPVFVGEFEETETTGVIYTSDSTSFAYVLAAFDSGGTLSAYSASVFAAPIGGGGGGGGGGPGIFSGVSMPIGSSGIVESGLSLVRLLTPILIISLVIWFAARMIGKLRQANGQTQSNVQNIETKPRRRTKQEIESDRKIKAEIREEKRRISKLKRGLRIKMSRSLGYKIYKKD